MLHACTHKVTAITVYCLVFAWIENVKWCGKSTYKETELSGIYLCNNTNNNTCLQCAGKLCLVLLEINVSYVTKNCFKAVQLYTMDPDGHIPFRKFVYKTDRNYLHGSIKHVASVASVLHILRSTPECNTHHIFDPVYLFNYESLR